MNNVDLIDVYLPSIPALICNFRFSQLLFVSLLCAAMPTAIRRSTCSGSTASTARKSMYVLCADGHCLSVFTAGCVFTESKNKNNKQLATTNVI